MEEIDGILWSFTHMEEVMGADPTSSGWKPDILAGKLYLHKGADRLNP